MTHSCFHISFSNSTPCTPITPCTPTTSYTSCTSCDIKLKLQLLSPLNGLPPGLPGTRKYLHGRSRDMIKEGGLKEELPWITRGLCEHRAIVDGRSVREILRIQLGCWADLPATGSTEVALNTLVYIRGTETLRENEPKYGFRSLSVYLQTL